MSTTISAGTADKLANAAAKYDTAKRVLTEKKLAFQTAAAAFSELPNAANYLTLDAAADSFQDASNESNAAYETYRSVKVAKS